MSELKRVTFFYGEHPTGESIDIFVTPEALERARLTVKKRGLRDFIEALNIHVDRIDEIGAVIYPSSKDEAPLLPSE